MQINSLVMLVRGRVDVNRPFSEIYPEKNVVYTVREFDKDYFGNICIRLEEIVNEKYLYAEGYFECCFPVEAFVEIQPPMSLDFIYELQLKTN